MLTDKKISLEGESCVLDSEDDEDEDDAQVPSSLVKRQYEATTVVNDEFKDGAMIVLPGANQFKLGTSSFFIQLSFTLIQMQCSIVSNVLVLSVTVPVQGHIVIRERVKELQLPKIKIPKEKPRKLPSGIKERHPVYGSDFTKILEEMEAAPTKKKRKKSYEPESAYPNGFTPTYLTTATKNYTEIESDDPPPSVSHKKKKKKDKNRELEADEVDAGSRSVSYENGYSDPVHHNNNINEDNSFGSKKKSKKRKRDESEEPMEEDLNKTILIEDSEPVPKKSKKSKHKHRE